MRKILLILMLFVGTAHADIATVFDPVSNVRKEPNGKILCKIKKVKKIEVLKFNKNWYSTNVCGSLGVIHKSQLKFSKKPKKKEITVKETPKKPVRAIGNYVCSTITQGKNGWCGYITQVLGDSVRVENYKVFCRKGGFLGFCTNVSLGSCGGNTRLFTDDSGENYKNPKSLIIPTYCLD